MTKPYNYLWRVREMVLGPFDAVELVAPNQQTMATVRKATLQKLLLAHFRVSKAAGIQAELFIVDGKDPNAFATSLNGIPSVGVNFAMLELLQDDANELASLLGHEVAHLVKGHGAAGRTRSNTLQLLGSAAGMGLGAAGVPVGGVISGLAVDLIDTAYDREQEREADALGVEYATKAGHDASGALRLQEKLLKTGRGPLLPFLSSHPTGHERIQNLKTLITAKNDPAAASSPSSAPTAESRE